MKPILFLYRLYPGEGCKSRPLFYSKELALKSFIEAYRAVDHDKRLIMVVDSNDLSKNMHEIVCGEAESTLFLGGIGNSNSYMKTLDYVESADNVDYFYLSEDDYLYRPNAFLEFVDVMNSIVSPDYVTLYDHPHRYMGSDNRTYFYGEKIFVAGRHHWRTVESTCMTFGGRISALRADIGIHRSLSHNKQNPRDRQIWYKTLGIGRYFWRFPKRLLIGPIPSLATHMEDKFLAPTVDWNSVSKNYS